MLMFVCLFKEKFESCPSTCWKTHFNLPKSVSYASRFFDLLNVFHFFFLHWILLSFSVGLDDGLLPSLKPCVWTCLCLKAGLTRCRIAESLHSKITEAKKASVCRKLHMLVETLLQLDFASFLAVFYWFEYPSCVLCCLIQSLVVGLRELDQSLS